MEGFLLTSSSIASLAEFTLSFIILIYLLSLKDKSNNVWYYIVTLIISGIYFFIAFIYYSTLRNPINQVLFLWLSLTLLSQMWFTYKLGGNPFKREMRMALLVTAILFAIAFYKDPKGLLTYPINMAGHLWNMLVFLRKAEWISKNGRLHFRNSFRGVSKQIFQPANRESRMFRDFSGWSLILLIVWVNMNLVFPLGYIWISHTFFQCMLHSLLYFSIIYLAIIYLNYSRENTSFQAKLTGVVLCVVLTLLGIIPFILFGFGIHSSKFEQNTLVALGALIPIFTLIILVVLPLFFRLNLLKSLNKIVAGVKRVNAGELQTSVSVEVKDELGSLATHFNEMTNSLRQYSFEMEKLVALRTEELSRSLEELKSTQAQLIQSEKMASLGELTAGIAHEIQNPLNFVNNFSEVNTELIEELKSQKLKVKSERDEQLEDELLTDISQNLEKIAVHGKRADAIVKGMLQHSRASTGKKKPTDINALADEYLRLSYHGLRAKDKSFNATIETHFDESIGKIEVIPQDIGRVLLNLFNNAFYAVKPPNPLKGEHYEPKVTVTTKRISSPSGAGGLEIRVKDNGIGIPQKAIDKIFQPFFTTKPTGQGTGLGLSLSYDIIKAHGGEIKVESKEGEGSEFIIQLPINKA